LIFNYKFHVDSVVDGRTIKGMVDIGFRDYKHRHFQLSGMDFPDIRRITDPVERQHAEERWALATPALKSLLLYRPHEQVQVHGRTIVIAPHTPNKYGRCLVNAYVACEKEHFEYPHLTLRRAGYVFINVVHFMQHLGERGFDVEVGKEILDICEPYDFDK
jgi:hypothetical protein